MRDLVHLYHQDLDTLYAKEEVDAIFRLVVEESLGWDTTRFLVERDGSLSESELLKVYMPLKRLKRGEPLQYVLGRTRFMGMPIGLCADVLIPRPETEEMVDRIVRTTVPVPRTVVDVGTGSGAIALALARAFPSAKVLGLDLSRAALAQAQRNGEQLGARVEWQHADVLAPDQPLPPADLIVSNPPYIPRTEATAMARHVVDHEPAMALFVDDADPNLFLRTIARKALDALPQGGDLWLEGHSAYVADAVGTIREMGYAQVQLYHDLAGLPRTIHAVR